VIVLVPVGATIPFHNIWVSLTLLYGFRLWSLGATVPILGAVCLGSGAAMTATIVEHGLAVDELAEVPMMASMFIAMVWHARRHQAAMEKLQRSGEREREFVRHASHQLRTPITVARGHVELVRLAAVDEQSAEDTEVVLGELDRLSRISDRLLILAAAEHVDFIARAPVDLAELVAGTVRRWSPVADRDWRADVEAHGWIAGDVDRLEAALDALVENSIKATLPGELIEVALRAERGEAIVEVRDGGVGLAPEDAARAFDRFWTAHNGRAMADDRGTGLGLATVRAIAEAHGGSVQALPRAGGGTRMIVRLGALRHDPAPEALGFPEDEALAAGR
jgi:signal transduction histidine kinase